MSVSGKGQKTMNYGEANGELELKATVLQNMLV